MTWTTKANLKGGRGDQGPQGPQGPQGLPGAASLPTADAVAAYVSTPGVVLDALTSTFERVIAITPDMSQTDIQTKMSAAATGDRIFFAAGTYTLTSPLSLSVGGVFIDALAATFTQTTWGQAVFDLLNVSDCLVDVGVAQFVGTRAGMGSSFRGSAQYCFGAGVWTNGDRNYIRTLHTVNLPVGVFFSSWGGTSTYDRVGADNRIGKLVCEGYNFGILWVGQTNLTIDDLTCHDDLDDSGGTNPTHGIYCSATTTFRASGGTLKRGAVRNNLTGHAFQLKFADSFDIGSITADNAKGLLNIIDCNDLTITKMAITNSLNTGGLGAFAMQRSVTNSQRTKVLSASIALGTNNDELAVNIVADDGQFNSLNMVVTHSGAVNTAINDVNVRGSRNRIRAASLTSSGIEHARGISVGVSAEPANATLIENLVVNGQRSGVDVRSGSRATVNYDPSVQTLTGTGTFITQASAAEQVSVATRQQTALSTFGDHANVMHLVAGSVSIQAANSGVQCVFTPVRDIVLSSLVWFSVTAGGNYDIALYDDLTGTRLWSKGSTAWPAAGQITEAGVAGVTLRSGHAYRVAFSSDAISGALRGVTGPTPAAGIRLDGRPGTTVIGSIHPLPATLVYGATASVRVPLIIVQGT